MPVPAVACLKMPTMCGGVILPPTNTYGGHILANFRRGHTKGTQIHAWSKY